MNSQFDPYRAWLQIPPDRRPPSYYDLLGVAEDESDPRRIEEAATERLARVRARALGDWGEHVTPLLNEISQALDCLSRPASRNAYDEKRLQHTLDRWLEAGRWPADFYEIVDACRFTPDRQYLLRAARSARQYLADRLGRDGTAEPSASELLIELEAGEQALGAPGVYRQYHVPILGRLFDEYAQGHGNDPALWDAADLASWLVREKRVHPGRSGAIARGMCAWGADAADRLLGEWFPDAAAEDPRQPGPAPFEGERLEGAGLPVGPTPPRPRPRPPRLPPVLPPPVVGAPTEPAPEATLHRSRRSVWAVLVLVLFAGAVALALGLAASRSHRSDSADVTMEPW
jgi:hypothetical protein